jgi:hypothetical protein
MSLVPRSLSLSLALSFALTGFLGCESEPPLVDGIVVQRIDLAESLGTSGVDVTGVTVDPLSGDRYVLDATSGIHRLDRDGAASLVLALESFPVPDVPVQSAWRDLAAMGDGRFALVAKGDGYRLDVAAGTLQQWFCYEPGWMDPEEFAQESHNLAYDVATDQILSAPVTVDALDGETITRSDVAVFDGAGAGDLQWFPVEHDGFGGIALDADGSLLLGADDLLLRYRLGETETHVVGSLRAHGVGDIAGLSFDANAGYLLVVDGADAELVVLDLGELEDELSPAAPVE